MAQSPFSSKSHPIAGSLAFRVFVVSTVLLVIPLTLYMLFIYSEERRLQIQDMYETLELIAQGEKRVIDQKFYFRAQELPSMKEWLDEEPVFLQGGAFPFHRSLLTLDGRVLISDPSAFPIDQVYILSPEDFKWSVSHLFRQIPEKVGIEVRLKEAPILLLISASQKEILKQPGVLFLMSFFLLLALVLILGGIGTFLLTHRMAKPLKSLYQDIQRVCEGDLTVRYAHDRLGFEINVLGERFNEMISSLLKQMEEIKTERLSKELLASELKIGREIQRSIIPKTLPSVSGLDMAAGFIPASEVAGDFYDLFVQQENLLMAIGDASGKGVAACLYSLMARSMLRSYDYSGGGFKEILMATNNLLCLDTADTGYFVTAWIGLYHAGTGRLEYSCCGHCPALLRRKGGEIEELSTPGIALGAVELSRIDTGSISFSPGDTLLLYTDGIIEAEDRNQNQFGKERLRSLLERDGDASAEQIAHRLLEGVSRFSEKIIQQDDLTFLVVKYPQVKSELFF